MIGIVVVSHSRALAEAAKGLAGEMVGASSGLKIEIAAGLDATTFGTDAAAVAEAIGKADSPDGVLLLVDLGSAILSAELALEFVEADVAERVTISSAPLVEGLVAAAVIAATGASLAQVAAEAQRGLLAKQDHLGDAGTSATAVSAASGDTDASQTGGANADVSAEIEVVNAHGLHARPAAQLVSLVASFDAATKLTHLGSGRGPVDAASLSMVATLNARQGDRLRVDASGPDAQGVVDAVVDFAEQGFGDEDTSTPVAQTSEGSAVRAGGSGLDLAVGVAFVPVLHVDLTGYRQGTSDEELSRSKAAEAKAREDLAALASQSASAEAGIFAAQRAMVADPAVVEPVREQVARGVSAPAAWSDVLAGLVQRFESLDDPYQRERAQDIRALERRILRALTGTDEHAGETPSTDGPQVLVVPELDAATAATLDARTIVGVVTTSGGATGHGAIVARSRGIPIATGVAAAADVHTGQRVAFDSRSGEFVVDPDEATQARYADLAESRRSQQNKALSVAFEPAVTTDGKRIAVVANVSSIADAEAAAAMGAEGAGLVRTEVLFGTWRAAPTIDEQVEAFIGLSRAIGGKPITIRTWDVGGDKPLPFLPQPHEANPFLGVRGLRLSRAEPAALHDQLAAACIASREAEVKVMFPMVTTAAEVDWALSELERATASASGRSDSLQVGIMIEVPAAALQAKWLAARLDFVSIGTNDLTQYTLAAERGNAGVADLADPLDPSIVGLIRRVCEEVPSRVEVAVCGDLASRTDATALLVGCGVSELSTVAPAIPAVKARVREFAHSYAQVLAREAESSESADIVRKMLVDTP